MDRLIFGDRYVMLLEGLAVPSVQDVRKALDATTAAGPHTRTGLRPHLGWLWPYVPETQVPVHVLPAEIADADRGTILEFVSHQPHPRQPVEITISDRHVVLDADHALGDGVFTVRIFAAIFTALQPNAPWLSTPDSRLPLVRAAARTFGRRPRLLYDAVRLEKSRKAAVTRPDRPGDDAPVEWSPSFASSSVIVDRDLHDAVDRWRRAHAPSCGASVAWLVICHRALAAAGLPVADEVMVAFNCRRYLAENAAVWGNFGAGLAVSVPAERPLSDLGTEVRSMIDCGVPLAVQLAASAIVQLRSSVSSPAYPARISADPPLRMMYSDLGRLTELDELPWLDTAVPSYAGLLDPATPESLTMFSTIIRGRRTLSATFHDNVFERNRVDAAMELIRSDPLALVAGGPATGS